MFILEGTYGSYKLSPESAKALEDWMISVKVNEPVQKNDLHITTTYSKTDVDIQPSKEQIILKKEDLKLENLGRVLVLLVKSDDLQKIHDAAIEAGADYDYDTYKPHITLSYNAEANQHLYSKNDNVEISPSKIKLPDFDITLDHEEIEALKEHIILEKIKNTLNDIKLDETFEMQKWYTIWGWIKPDGKLLLPTKENRENRNISYHHMMILPDNITYTKAMRTGWTRFFMEGSTLMLNSSTFQDYNHISAIISGVSSIENLIIKNSSSKQKELDQIFSPYDEIELPKFIDYVIGTGSNSVDDSIEIEFDDRALYKSLRKNFEKYNNKIQQKQEPVNEWFEMEGIYKFWGWVKPDGSLLLPTVKMRKSKNQMYTHEEILSTYIPNSDSYDDGYNAGMIRFLILNDTLLFDVPDNCKPDAIIKGYRNIENYTIKQQNNLKELFGNNETYIKNFRYEIKSLVRNKYVRTSKKKYWQYHSDGESLTQLVNKIKKLQEEVPANSTTNIPAVPQPLKTFGMFRRKSIEK